MDSYFIRLVKAVYTPGLTLCVSPLGLYRVLSNLLIGSSGKAKEELECLLDGERSILCGKKDTTELLYGSLILCKNGFDIKKSFIDSSKSLFNANVDEFKNKKDVDRLTNTWIKDVTSNMIRSIELDIKDNTRMIILSAVYFNSEWKNTFDSCLTHKLPFNRYDGTTVLVDTMYDSGSIYHYTYDKCIKSNVVLMDYKNDRFSMMIIAPDSIKGLDLVIEKLSTEKINHLLIKSKSRSDEIELFLPKFCIESEIQLEEVIKNLGCKGLFEDNGLMEISDDPSLHVSEIKQKSVIKVNESGTEASSVTSVKVSSRCLKFTHRIEINNPFMCIVLDKENNIPVFVTTYNGI
nr:CPPV315 serpin family protein [Cooks petrelpox virus]